MVRSVMDSREPPTFFEFVTAMAFQYFVERKVDLAILETGMGGRLDATNVARPIAGVITNISVEHTAYLGRTLAEIAREKAGIIKPGMTILTGEGRPRVRAVFEETADRLGASLLALGRDFRSRARPDGSFDYYGLEINLKGLEKKLIGRHQIRNAALALAALEILAARGFTCREDHMRDGLKNVFWPGRAELFTGPPRLILDGAHNPRAAESLARTMAELEFDKLHLVLGIMSDKDIRGIMAPLLPLAHTLHLTRPQYFRSAETRILAEHAKDFAGPIRQHADIPASIKAARNEAGLNDLVLITGSLFTVGEARACLTGATQTPRAILKNTATICWY